jgi:hypothetical protein
MAEHGREAALDAGCLRAPKEEAGRDAADTGQSPWPRSVASMVRMEPALGRGAEEAGLAREEGGCGIGVEVEVVASPPWMRACPADGGRRVVRDVGNAASNPSSSSASAPSLRLLAMRLGMEEGSSPPPARVEQ